jgi:hypothetical protein
MANRRRGISTFCLVSAAVMTAGCVGIVAPRSAASVREPRISWRILTGSPGGSDQEICRSDRPQRECVLQASTAADPRIAAVSVFLYATETPITYTGAVLVRFIAVNDRLWYELNLRDYQLDPGERPAGVTATGRIVSEPGTYTVQIALLARRPGQREPTQLFTTVSVRVDARPTT